ncbi:4-phosphopantetheinyl transferase protein [Haloferula helveola]|uniref:4-phosphopantetheinyl transferase protein n=1 Tax=Haloferula helveola TaxID=490095 RepID=A0ABN6H598_9BACT|nr:4-phosphopantetheinyl transferase protein [Haloferula helveola]
MSRVILHLIEPDTEDSTVADAILSTEERERAARFVFDSDRTRWTAIRAAARRILASYLDTDPASIEWKAGEGGKPYIPSEEFEFNLSHSGELAALAVSTAGPVGIDLEPVSRAIQLPECEESFCHPLELSDLPKEPSLRALALLELWTAKEALLKAHGSGLAFPPTSLRIEGTRGIADLPGLDQFHLLRPLRKSRPEFSIAVAVPLRINEIDLA